MSTLPYQDRVATRGPKTVELVESFFRLEAGRMIATLTGIFGFDNIDIAEDVVQDAMIKALQQWSFGSIPQNPSGWIMQVAKNRALDILRQKALQDKKEEDLSHWMQARLEERSSPVYFSEKEIKDDQLRMIFACCHPILSEESKIALTLKTLCGLSVGEIARAFLTNEQTIAKRLVRAKQRLADIRARFEIPSGNHLSNRLDSVLRVVYLLFNEGYNASRGRDLIRWDLSSEALRLSEMLLEHPLCHTPKSNALHALMLLQAARFPARMADDGNILLLKEQDRSRWNRELIEQGLSYLDEAASGEELSTYHLQAGIAACHSVADSYEATDWKKILSLYDLLVDIDASPVMSLNRAVAVAKVHGPTAGLRAVEKTQDAKPMGSYYLLHAVMAEFYLELGNLHGASAHLLKALALTHIEAEQAFLKRKLMLCETLESNGHLPQQLG